MSILWHESSGISCQVPVHILPLSLIKALKVVFIRFLLSIRNHHMYPFIRNYTGCFGERSFLVVGSHCVSFTALINVSMKIRELFFKIIIFLL